MACSENEAQSLIKFLESKDIKYSAKIAEYQTKKNNALIEYKKFIENKYHTFINIKNVVENQYDDENDNKWASLVSMLEVIIQNEREFESLNKKYDKTLKDLEDCKIKFLQQTSQRSDYYTKLSRRTLFATEDERNKWIHRKIEKLDKKILHSQNMLENMRLYGEDIKSRLTGQHYQIIGFIRQKERARGNIPRLNQIKSELAERKFCHRTSRQDLCSQEKIHNKKMISLYNTLQYIKNAIDTKKGNDILTGEKFMKKFITADNQNFYLGLLIENFKCDKEFYNAVDIILGKKLYSHIILDEYLAKYIMNQVKILNLGKAITIMSLDNLPSVQYTYPDNESIVPFITKLVYDEKLDKLMKYIFGNILICNNMDVAIEYSKNKEFICITSDGTHIPPMEIKQEDNLSRITLHNAHKQIMHLILASKNDMNNLKRQLGGLESDIAQTMNGVKLHEQKSFQNKRDLEKASSNLLISQDKYKNLLSMLKRNEICMKNMNSTLFKSKINKYRLQSELSKNMIFNVRKYDVKLITNNVVKLNNQLEARLDHLETLEKEKSKKKDLIKKLNSKYDIIRCEIKDSSALTKHKILQTHCNIIDEINKKILKFNNQINIFDQQLKIVYKKLTDIKCNLKLFQNDNGKQ